ncbi:hypothetical protein, partial [uncultured Pseudomonas sp.]|uniref:hypothetical protein n=1 Tax=uncultured Pseudomonas sp. TaxID=114707 RepID=UPI002596EF51
FLESPQGLIRIAVSRSLHGRCHQPIPGFLEQSPDVNVQLISNVGASDFFCPSGAVSHNGCANDTSCEAEALNRPAAR